MTGQRSRTAFANRGPAVLARRVQNRFSVGLRGISVSLGPRIDGIPLRDYVGGNSGFRRPGYSLYLDPGVVVPTGRSTWSVNVPLRVHQDFQRSLADIERGAAGGGDLARYLLLIEYTVRF